METWGVSPLDQAFVFVFGFAAAAAAAAAVAANNSMLPEVAAATASRPTLRISATPNGFSPCLLVVLYGPP